MANGVNENGVATPSQAQYAGGNGVAMPGPRRSGDEVGFDPVGRDMSNVIGSPAYIVGVQLPPGPTENETAWSFGGDFAGLAPLQMEPDTNQNFGVHSSDTGQLDGDDPLFTSIRGTQTANTEPIPTDDILGVFNLVADHDRGGSGTMPSATIMGFDAMRGIPLGAGSGTYVGGVQVTNSPRPEDNPYQAGDMAD